MILSKSVAICTYNGEKYIKEQLESLINQSVLVDEIILCDDCSIDSTLEIAENVLSKCGIKYKIIQNENNLGFIKNFEKCISLCSSEVIFLSDQDDIWLNNKVEKILNVFKTNENVDLVFTNAYLVDDRLSKFKKDLWQSFKFNYKKYDPLTFTRELLKTNFVTGATVAFKKSVLINVLPFPNNWVHDHWIALISSLKNNVFPLDEKLILYRQHSNNVYGANNSKLSLKIKNYLKTFNQNDLYIKKYNQIITLKQHLNDINLSNDKIDLIDEYFLFWKEYTKSEKSLQNILRNIINLGYFKYYIGVKSIIRDLIKLFI